MAPDISSPPRAARIKCPAISSPPNPARYNRDQSEIACSWWAKKKDKVVAFKRRVSQLQERVRILEEEAQEANEKITGLEAALEEAIGGRDPNVEKLIGVVNSFGGFQRIEDKGDCKLAIGALLVSYLGIIMRKTHPVTRLRVVCDVLFKNAIFGVESTRAVLDEIYKKYIYMDQRRVFLPWKILRAIDMSIAGSLNYNGLETLRSVEELGHYQRGILPSRSQIQRASYELHNIAQEIIPFGKKESQLGEMFSYDYECFIRYILKSFHLYEIAQRESVEICMTLDGAELCDGLSHLTAGIKISDHRAIDARDGVPLSSLADGVFGRIFKVQSRNYCFAMKSLLGKDCKTAYREFSDFFLFFERLKSCGLPETEQGPRIMPMEVWSPQDLSSIWKSLNTGGGARKNGNTYFCHVCPCTGNTIARFLVDENRLVVSYVLFLYLYLIHVSYIFSFH
jgi:hypothetical protein